MKKIATAFVRGSLWLLVLVPILGVSAYSFFYVARYLGAPWYIAAAVSTCFDGVALLAANYSVRYAQEGLSGSAPRTVVRVFALLAAYLQTLHARIGHEPAGSWILWAALPIAAVLVYEIHIRWERRKALARAGSVYPAPLPAFGFSTWVLFPLATLRELRGIVRQRREVLVAHARPATPAPTAQPIVSQANYERKGSDVAEAPAEAAEPAREPGSHTPVIHIREWAKANAGRYGWTIGDRAPLPRRVHDEYHRAHREHTHEPPEESETGL